MGTPAESPASAPTTVEGGADDHGSRAWRAAELYEQDPTRTLQDVADALGVSASTVTRDLRALDVPRRPAAPPRRYPLPEPRPCAWCGKIFTPPATTEGRRGGRYCTRDHANRAKRKHPDPGERVCARDGCDNRFTPPARDVARGHGRYCTRDCYWLAERRHPEPSERPCANCGRLFTPKQPALAVTGRGKYCDLFCARLAIIGRGDLSHWSGRARQKRLGIWSARKPPKPLAKRRGPPEVSVTDA